MAFIFVGTYTSKGSEGIYTYRMDPKSGGLHLLSVTTGVAEPSFLARSPTGNFLYAVNELVEGSEESGGGERGDDGSGGVPSGGDPSSDDPSGSDPSDGESSRISISGGSVSAFAFDPATGELTRLNRQPSNGWAPCHLTVDRTGRFLLVTNYVSGSTSVMHIRNDGRLEEATCVIQHQGRSQHPRRQAGPHAHSVNLDWTNRFALVADLGLDRLMIYRFDSNRGLLVPNDKPWIEARPGAGPRHLVFHPSRHFIYLINELDSTITGFRYDEEHGHVKEIQNISTLPKEFSGTNSCADIHIDPSGRFLYGSNRGHDTIAIYRIDQETGLLSLTAHVPTQGRKPRNFMIEPNGDYLFVANQDSDTIVTFRIDKSTGKLEPTGKVSSVPSPVCLLSAVG